MAERSRGNQGRWRRADSGAPVAVPARPGREEGLRTRSGTRAATVLLAPLLAASLAGLTAGLRLFHLTYSLDVFVDEITYTDIIGRLAQHAYLGTGGGPFYLHPPLFFALEALWWKVFQPSGNILQQISTLRPLTVLLAVLIDALLFYIAYRWRGLLAAVPSALLYAVDPFLVRWSSMVMLETATVFWALAGLAVLAGPLRSGAAIGRRRAIAAGFLMGCAIVTKDTGVFLTLAVLGVFVLLERRQAARFRPVLVALTSVAVYAVYVVYVALFGDFGAFWSQKSRGLRRAAGLLQESGFHRKGSLPFSQVLLANLDQYAATYALIGLGLLAALLLWRRGGSANRMAAALVGGPLLYLTYSVAFGALEEQYFYYLVVASVLAAPLAATAALRRRSARLPRPVPRAIAALALVAVFAAFDLGIWAALRTQADNGYQRLFAFMADSLPAQSRIGDDLGDPLWIAVTRTEHNERLQAEGVPYLNQVFGPWYSKKALRLHRVQYMVVDEKLVHGHYLRGTPAFYQWVATHGQLVFSFSEASYERLDVYRLPPGY